LVLHSLKIVAIYSNIIRKEIVCTFDTGSLLFQNQSIVGREKEKSVMTSGHYQQKKNGG